MEGPCRERCESEVEVLLQLLGQFQDANLGLEDLYFVVIVFSPFVKENITGRLSSSDNQLKVGMHE